MVEYTQQEAIARFKFRCIFGLLRQPTAVLKVYPLCLMLILEKGDVLLI
jgi:hypothetical protein